MIPPSHEPAEASAGALYEAIAMSSNLTTLRSSGTAFFLRRRIMALACTGYACPRVRR